jgi:PAS domain S-box-containing protein
MENSAIRIEPILKGRGKLMIKRIRKSLTLKWMIFSILLATIPLTIAGFNIIQIYQKDLKKSVVGTEEMKAGMMVERTEAFFDKITSNLLSLVNAEDFKIGISSSYIKNLLENLLYQSDTIWELALLDERGRERMKVSKYKVIGSEDLINQSKTEMFKVASKGIAYYGEFRLTKDMVPTMEIAVPVEEYKRKPVGVLSAKIHLRYLWNLIPQIQIGKEGSTYVVDKKGHLIAHPDTRKVLLGHNLKALPLVDQVVSGKEGHLEFEYPGGEKVLCLYKPIKKLGWGVIVEVPVKEAYEPLRQVAHAAFMWILVGLVIAVLLSLFLTRKLTLPIKRLSSGIGEVTKGNLDASIPPTTQDELGLLTESFNQMIQDLKQSQEALKEAEEKYRRIFEKSKDMVFITSVDGKFIDVNQAGVEMLGYENKEELFKITVKDTYLNPQDRQKFIYEIANRGFAKDFETKLKRNGGTPIDVLITANVRKDEEGHIIGYEGTIKNISFRKRMEEELLQRKEELQTLYDMSLLINRSLDLDELLLIALEKATSLTGFEMGAIHFVNEHTETLELRSYKEFSPVFLENVKVLKYGEGVAGKAVMLKRPVVLSIDDAEVRLMVGIPLMTKERAIGAITLSSRSVRELTQREINLLESIGNQIGLAFENAILFSAVAKAKSEWETTFDAVTDLITIRDNDYRIIRANKAAFKRYGLKPEQMIDKKCFEMLHQIDQPCEGCYVSETLEAKKPVSGERDSKYLKGIFQYHTFPIYDEGGEIVAVVDLAREITEQKRLEIEKEIVNNIDKILASSLDLRQVMKAVHSELKRVLDSERMTIVLFDETGGFRYLVQEEGDETKELVGHAIYPRKGTPFEKVIETGLPFIVPDTGKSDFWIDQKAARTGTLSVLVFPLEYKGRTIGAMNFGSKESHHFSDPHIRLLHSIASGLAISIQNALLFEETKKRLDEFTMLYEIMKISASSLNLDLMLREIINSLNRFFKFEAFGIALIDENTKRLVLHPSFIGHSVKEIEKLELCLGKGITGRVAEKGIPLLINDVRSDSRYIAYDENINSEMCVPLNVGQKVIGVIDAQSRALNAFSEDDLRLLGIVGGQLATIIENIQLYEEIKTSEEKYRTVVEGAIDGVVVIGEDLKFKYVNERIPEILGYPKDELIGMDFGNSLDEESKQSVVDRFIRRQRGEQVPPRHEFNIIRKDGGIRNVEVSSTIVRDSHGKINTISFLKDVTEKKKMEEQLLQAEKLRALAEMASGVAHDFNNALAAILGNTQLLIYTVQDEELRETLRTIEKVAKDSAQTVRRLQDFTRKRAHQGLFKVDVNFIIKDSIEITKPKWKDEVQSRGIRIEIVPSFGDIPSVSGTASELREVFTNMIFNAIEAMPDGGKIEIRTFQKRKEVFIQVSDTGIGINEEARKKIFEPFFTTKPFTNTGLGLSMSYGIIKRFGGEIEVESKVGHGTTFTIVLPIGGEEREEVTSPPTLKKGKKARILVIDDEEFVRSVLSRTLTQVSHQVTLAEDGEKGIQLFKEGRFDMVLTDLGMPGMSGWEVCQMIKKISPDTSVGMITGWGIEMSRSKMEEYGLDFFISKPFDFNQILNVVAETMESRQEGLLS